MCRNLQETKYPSQDLAVHPKKFLHQAMLEILDATAGLSCHSENAASVAFRLSGYQLVALLICRYIVQTERAKNYELDQTHVNMLCMCMLGVIAFSPYSSTDF